MRVLSMDLEHRNLAPEQAQLITGMVTVELSTYDALDVISGADIRRAMALEGEKQSAGCTSDTSCLAEVANAFDAELVLFGEIGVLNATTVINLNLYDPRTVQTVGRTTVRAGSLDDLPDALRPALRTMLERPLAARGHALAPASTNAPVSSTAPAGRPSWPWWLAGGGAVVAAVGGVVAVVGLGPAFAYQGLADQYAASDDDNDKRPLLQKAEAKQAEFDDGGRALFFSGVGLGVVGIVGVVAGVGLGVAVE
jgi:hypothetical protein